MPYSFSYHKEKLVRKIRKINNLNSNIIFCCILQFIVLFASIEISKIFNFKLIKIKFLNFYSKKILIIYLSYFYFILIFYLTTFILILIDEKNGLQISNFLFFFYINFNLCLKIGKSEKFSNWIGSGLDETMRIFVMFIICLNCVYFLTRITHSLTLLK
ncbi:MAG: hypothetical protein CMN00_05080 [Rickettsiales bacterium]|nr:hypothetical protein [Rickettsiales bacterium]